MLQWLRAPEREGGPCQWDETTCWRAAVTGNLSLLQWLRNPETGGGACDWGVLTCAGAAHNGNLALMKWMREEANPPCPWNASACASAAAAGNLAVLKWMREEATPPCPWDPSTLRAAVDNRRRAVFFWALYEANPACEVSNLTYFPFNDVPDPAEEQALKDTAKAWVANNLYAFYIDEAPPTFLQQLCRMWELFVSVGADIVRGRRGMSVYDKPWNLAFRGSW